MEKNKKTKVSTSKQKIRIKKKAMLLLVALLLVLIVAIIGICYGIRCLVITLKYKEYTEKMYTYGLADLYDNKKATAIAKVSNDEMLKIVLTAVSGKKDIDEIYFSGDTKEEYKWLQFATDAGYTNNINESNLKDKASKIETALTATRGVDALLGIELQQAELDMSKSKLAKFNTQEKEIIAKAVSMGIINNKNSSLSDEPILKGELNKLVVTIVEKYATIYYKTMAYNEQGILEKQNINIVTDIDKMPENYKDYPYIIDSIPTEIYEYDFDIITERNSQTPKVAYQYMGDLYGQIDEIIVNHFNKLLNIDYTNITYEGFLDDIQGTVLYELTEKDVKPYVDYVKANKIKLSGRAEPLLPIIYNNGEQYIVRTKLTFNVLSSNTEYNLLFGDEDQKVKYNGKEITMYVDVPMGMTLNSWSLRAYVDCLAKHLIANNTAVIIEE